MVFYCKVDDYLGMCGVLIHFANISHHRIALGAGKEGGEICIHVARCVVVFKGRWGFKRALPNYFIHQHLSNVSLPFSLCVVCDVVGVFVYTLIGV